MTTREWIENLFDSFRETPEPMTLEAAASDIANFRAEGWDVPEDLTAEEYAETWNELIG